jgi:hypothetical protein
MSPQWLAQTWNAKLVFQGLRHRARILVEQGCSLIGIADETGCLGPNEVRALRARPVSMGVGAAYTPLNSLGTWPCRRWCLLQLSSARFAAPDCGFCSSLHLFALCVVMPQVFVCYHRPGSTLPVIREGPVLLTKNPAFHPGDIRVVQVSLGSSCLL